MRTKKDNKEVEEEKEEKRKSIINVACIESIRED